MVLDQSVTKTGAIDDVVELPMGKSRVYNTHGYAKNETLKGHSSLQKKKLLSVSPLYKFSGIIQVKKINGLGGGGGDPTTLS